MVQIYYISLVLSLIFLFLVYDPGAKPMAEKISISEVRSIVENLT